jgi:hypothetical protein
MQKKVILSTSNGNPCQSVSIDFISIYTLFHMSVSKPQFATQSQILYKQYNEQKYGNNEITDIELVMWVTHLHALHKTIL